MSPFCTNCGRELEESWNVCPECGKLMNDANVQQINPRTQPQSYPTTQISPQPRQVQPYQYTTTKVGDGNKYGPISLVFGIIGILFTFLFGFMPISFGFPIFRIAAIILGAIGINKDENNSMAITGLILGIIGIAFYVVSSFSRLISLFYW